MNKEEINFNTYTNEYLFSHKNSFNKDLGNLFKKIRISKHITREQLSEMLLTSTSYIAQLENGTNGITLIKFLATCNALSITPQSILEELIYNSNPQLENNMLIENFQNEKNLANNLLIYMKLKKII